MISYGEYPNDGGRYAVRVLLRGVNDKRQKERIIMRGKRRTKALAKRFLVITTAIILMFGTLALPENTIRVRAENSVPTNLQWGNFAQYPDDRWIFNWEDLADKSVMEYEIEIYKGNSKVDSFKDEFNVKDTCIGYTNTFWDRIYGSRFIGYYFLVNGDGSYKFRVRKILGDNEYGAWSDFSPEQEYIKPTEKMKPVSIKWDSEKYGNIIITNPNEIASGYSSYLFYNLDKPDDFIWGGTGGTLIPGNNEIDLSEELYDMYLADYTKLYIGIKMESCDIDKYTNGDLAVSDALILSDTGASTRIDSVEAKVTIISNALDDAVGDLIQYFYKVKNDDGSTRWYEGAFDTFSFEDSVLLDNTVITPDYLLEEPCYKCLGFSKTDGGALQYTSIDLNTLNDDATFYAVLGRKKIVVIYIIGLGGVSGDYFYDVDELMQELK